MPTALVTGSNRGIGLAAALSFASRGWTVFAAARDPDGAERLALARAEGLDVRVVPLDVRQPASVEAALRAVAEAGAGLDVVVNNAAVMPVSPLEDQAVEDVVRTVETNLLGAMLVARAAVPIMRRAGSGVIVNVSWLSGRYRWSPPLLQVYNVTKAALVALSYELNKELLALGIRVHVVELGVWQTDGYGEILAVAEAAASDGSYGLLVRRLRAIGTAANPVAGQPHDAGEAIFEVATGPGDRVRYVIPAKAELSADAGDLLEDAEFLELCALDEPSAWFGRFNAMTRARSAKASV